VQCSGSEYENVNDEEGFRPLNIDFSEIGRLSLFHLLLLFLVISSFLLHYSNVEGTDKTYTE
jgi:hypothetical protein